ncbi:hypothetical protein KY290_006960 [Solanum tuberosum]|uniref:TIR domain-containing protein n=1 Tax=Solanum tuberosum TaxID=4113 RepID=A0ABQ7W467_SOLTU|nr:hypothetical protein KY290_006960 [Solanum tuberosum]
MASSSSYASNSQYCPRWKYDVFLSFRGEDTRRNFTSHLYQSLDNRGIFTFLDDKRLENGDSISEELVKAIEESQVAIIIFSKNYATSRWCLNELVKIMECKTQYGQTVIPVFYDVYPSHVQNQIESFKRSICQTRIEEKDNCVNNKEDRRSLLARRLRFKKVLVVLDDIDHIDQLDYLAGNLDWFGNGSRIIATTRDKHLIGKNVVYEVHTLHEHDAIKLFERYAFKEQVSDECFKELTLEVVSHAKGLPLALKVFGSFFHKRDITEWRSAIKQIKNNPTSEIVEKLKISYDGLETIQQSIFLDIACFLRGRRKDYVMQILESCDFGADIGLRVLIDKSLVFISGNNTIEMHDLIQDMGKYVVKKQKDPGERSRLWLTEDFEEVMINNTGTKAVEAIWVPNFNKPCFSKEAMETMQRLRILCIHDSNCLDGSVEYLPNNLRWFVWNNYPCESLPENFEPQKLVHLDLSLSSLRHLWTETKYLPFQQKLDLRDSRSLMQTPDFTWMPNLKYLDLSYCRNLEEVHHSLEYSRELIELNLYNCGRLKRFPCVNVESLDYMDLEFCSSFEKFPIIYGTMKPEEKDAAQSETAEEAEVRGEVECKLGPWYFENNAGNSAYVAEQLESWPVVMQ